MTPAEALFGSDIVAPEGWDDTGNLPPGPSRARRQRVLVAQRREQRYR